MSTTPVCCPALPEPSVGYYDLSDPEAHDHDSTRTVLSLPGPTDQLLPHDRRVRRQDEPGGWPGESGSALHGECRRVAGLAPLLRRKRDRLFQDQQPDPAA